MQRRHMSTSADLLDDIAIELFRRFARMEYALKAAGFHNGDGKAEANWDKFGCEIKGKLEADPEITDAVDYMTKSPPKKQIVHNGQLEWESPTPNASKTHELLLCVRRVRNNLFHGGKFNGHWFAPERSEELLRHSLKILDACLRASPKLNEAFES